MKKRTILGIVLSIVSILFLLGLGAYLMYSSQTLLTSPVSPAVIQTDSDITENLPETNDTSLLQPDTDEETLATEDPTSARQNTSTKEELTETLRTPDSQTAAALAAAQAENDILPEHHIIFVGDSRTVGMGEAEMKTDDTCLYVGAVGEGYYWFEETGQRQMENAMEQYPDSPIILNLGVNDPDALPQYLALYQTFEESYPGHTFYFMSVNPVTEKCKNRTNQEIADFNRQIRETFPKQYLDTNTYLQIREFESADGIHYSKDTYRMIHDYVVKQLFK